MKSCKDCKFYDVDPRYEPMYSCKVFGYPKFVGFIRESDKACGFDARWFEAKEKK
jgi:hypothetical protein